MNDMKKFAFAILLASMCLTSCKVSYVNDNKFPVTVYKEANTGSIVIINDTLAVVYNRTGLNTSEAQIINLKDF